MICATYDTVSSIAQTVGFTAFFAMLTVILLRLIGANS